MSTTLPPLTPTVTTSIRLGEKIVGDFGPAPDFAFPTTSTASASTIMNSSTAETEPSGHDAGGTSSTPLLLGILISIVGLAVLGAIAGRYRKKIRTFLHSRFPSRVNAPSEPPAPSSTTTEEARQERRRSERRRRRHDSQRSVRTLPVYSENPGGEELVLVRKRSSSLSSIASSENEDESMEERRERQSISAASPPRSVSPSLRTQRLVSTDSQMTQSDMGQAPTYLEAMSSIDLTEVARGDIEEGGQARSKPASAFRGLLGRMRPDKRMEPQQPMTSQQASTSLASLILSQSRSSLNPNSSTASLTISGPVQNSAVRASLDQSDLPSAGLSEQQMKFLGSPEVIGLVGRPFGEGEGQRRSRRSSSFAASVSPSVVPDEPSPPSWESLEQTRREEEARARATLARPIRQCTVPDELAEDSYVPSPVTDKPAGPL